MDHLVSFNRIGFF